MNTAIIVWVLMVTTPQWTPTIEFTSQRKCEVAAIAIKQQADPYIPFGSMTSPWCARIEK